MGKRNPTNQLLHDRGFPGALRFRQQMTVLFWAAFNKKKMESFVNHLKNGKNILLAFYDASKGI